MDISAPFVECQQIQEAYDKILKKEKVCEIVRDAYLKKKWHAESFVLNNNLAFDLQQACKKPINIVKKMQKKIQKRTKESLNNSVYMKHYKTLFYYSLDMLLNIIEMRSDRAVPPSPLQLSVCPQYKRIEETEKWGQILKIMMGSMHFKISSEYLYLLTQLEKKQVKYTSEDETQKLIILDIPDMQTCFVTKKKNVKLTYMWPIVAYKNHIGSASKWNIIPVHESALNSYKDKSSEIIEKWMEYCDSKKGRYYWEINA